MNPRAAGEQPAAGQPARAPRAEGDSPGGRDGASPQPGHGPRRPVPTRGDPNQPRTPSGGSAAPGAPNAPSTVPDKPRLTPGVEPAGQMQESAFVDPPWLLERKDAGYVHSR